jgi:hypothetical protein
MIVSAAIKYHLYPYDDTGGVIILPLHRHKDGEYILKTLGIDDIKTIEEGFLTEDGTFLDRRAAAEHVYECGQLIEGSEEPYIDVLFSEDLW